eukprot:1245851-Amphidinium_carterae.1
MCIRDRASEVPSGVLHSTLAGERRGAHTRSRRSTLGAFSCPARQLRCEPISNARSRSQGMQTAHSY